LQIHNGNVEQAIDYLLSK